MQFSTSDLAALIQRIAPDFKDLSFVALVDCVRHHIGGVREIEVEDAVAYLTE